MESALTISPPIRSARASARPDLPLAVGPAISQTLPMSLVITLVRPEAAALVAACDRLAGAVTAAGGAVKAQRMLGPDAMDWTVDGASLPALRQGAQLALSGLPVDVCVQPAEG